LLIEHHPAKPIPEADLDGTDRRNGEAAGRARIPLSPFMPESGAQTIMPAPDGLHALVERFERNRDAYRSGHYNETQVRVDFINPLFELLGWDVINRHGASPAYQDVVHEDAIKVGGAHKAPDYGFRVGGTRKFFVEAKKPSVSINDNPLPAFQLRRYAWSAKLPLSVLTDFEEFAVYDCRIQPDKDDSARIARSTFLTYDTFVDQWDEIASTFSREAVLAGSIDAYAETATSRRGTATVDTVFLREIEIWRELLARDLALHNPGLTRRELNFAVQMTIDRIVFLRMAEDRGIEDYGRLQALLNGGHTYERLRELYRQADERYNSGLFHFHAERGRDEAPDELTPRLTIDDVPLQQIIRSLYYPDSPYEFSVLPIEVLGQVYEQFLGKVIDISPKRQVTIEEKPEVRKAGGVYYTPKYIVDYIVEQTVGALLKGKKPGPRGAVSKLRIVDPACGSGSFLIGAYEYLLNWHRDRYIEDGPAKHRKELFQGLGGQWLLTTTEKKRILLNNIYGVDIDSQAVEVTKLSLLLKVLEGETSESIVTQLAMFRERALPDLSNNIKCGNSLIGPDFYDNQQMSFLDTEEHYRINVFDWKAAFPDVFSGDDSGFDAVIGNPPYILLEDQFRDVRQGEYFRSNFTTASYKLDTYHLFMQRGIELARIGGRCSMITPANFLTNNHLATLRRFMLRRSRVESITVVDEGVFHGISVDNAVFVVVVGEQSGETFPVIRVRAKSDHFIQESISKVDSERALGDKHVLFTGSTRNDLVSIWSRLEEENRDLGDIAFVNFGKQLRDRKKYPTDVVTLTNLEDIGGAYRPCYTGRDVTRYRVEWSGRACLDIEDARSGGCWDGTKQNTKEKILTRQIGQFPEFALDVRGFQCLNTMFMINIRDEEIDPLVLLGVLNSRLLRGFWMDRFNDRRRTFPKIKGTYLKKLPICSSNLAKESSEALRVQMCEFTSRIISLNEHFAEARTNHEQTILQHQIDAMDRQIDRLVYELYGLTEDEIAVVEGS